MGWRDRAEVIQTNNLAANVPQQSDQPMSMQSSDWKTRAEPISMQSGTVGTQQNNLLPENTQNLQEAGRFLQSILTGAGQGLTGGMLDEIMAAMKAAPNVSESPLQSLASMVGMRSQPSQFQQQYEQQIPQVRSGQKALQKEFPVASTVSDIAGTIAQPFKGFKQMVVQGAMQGFGRGEGSPTERAESAAVGAGLATAGYGLGKLTKAGLSKMFGKEAAGEMAIKQAAPRFTDVRHIEQRGLTLSEIGDELLNQKALSSTPENTLQKIQGKLKQQNITQKLSDLFKKEGVVIDGNRVLQELNDIIMDITAKHPERYSNAADEYLKFVAGKLHGQQLEPLTLKSLIRNLDKEINWNRQMSEQSGGALAGTEFLNDVRRAMESNLRTQIAEQATPKVRDAYLKANKTYELLSAAEDMFEYQTLKNKSGGFFPSGSPLTKIYEAAVYPINTLAPTAAYPMSTARSLLEKFPGQQGLDLLGELPTRGQKLQILGDQILGGQ